MAERTRIRKPLDPNNAPQGTIACLPEDLNNANCAGCVFAYRSFCPFPCSSYEREDGHDIIFKER